MSLAGTLATELLGKAGKPAHVTFRTVAKQLKQQSEREGRYIAKDVDMVDVRQIGSADSVTFEVAYWLKQNEADVSGERLPRSFADFYLESYNRWKSGQEMPVEGTPIRSWPVITPAQVEMLVSIGIRTVEDLSTLTDEGVKKVGMGGVDLKNKAKAWLAVAQDKGVITQQVTTLQKENALLKANLAALTETVELLKQSTDQKDRPTAPTIDAGDLLDDEKKPTRKR